MTRSKLLDMLESKDKEKIVEISRTKDEAKSEKGSISDKENP